ncbi:addiction module protein [Parasediminibacterium sp. JCM 36343]|uniref:addiction module protein n=1 Tax=Parasediminibacterium sp. JCM 36343 TaxID=3374279 RepID=UPI003978D7EC
MRYTKESLMLLPLEEKIALITDLWDSIGNQDLNQSISEKQKEWIRQRLEQDKNNLLGAVTWAELKKKYTS